MKGGVGTREGKGREERSDKISGNVCWWRVTREGGSAGGERRKEGCSGCEWRKPGRKVRGLQDSGALLLHPATRHAENLNETRNLQHPFDPCENVTLLSGK